MTEGLNGETVLKDSGNSGEKRLVCLEKDDFDRVFSIMEESFPIDERRTYPEQKVLIEKPFYNLYGIKSGKEVFAFISVYDFEKFCFIEHFAVKKEYRNQGLGAYILKECKALSGGKPVILEAEPPDTEYAARRIKFYERNGFYLNDYKYFQPPISKDRKAVPLLLMTTGGKISEERFLFMRSVIYEKVYGASCRYPV